MSIMNKAEELGDELLQTTEFKALKKAEKAMADDEIASQILHELQSKQKMAQMAQMNGKQVSPDLQNEIRGIQSRMQNNDKIKEYMEAQQNFNKVMQTVNQVISNKLQDQQE
ncbi:MAG: YlbF family regulator [Halanaerobium sp.]|nr:YlbF family regulator [Halanaerobium sp.]